MKRRSRASKVLIVIIVILIVIAAIIGSLLVYDYIEEIQYPLEHEEIIVKYSDIYDLDPYFVCALINTESGFDENAVSHANAQGLMQLMPETADWISSKLGYDSYDVFDPKTNIEFGCWYLNYLFGRFDNVEVILAAYNAGPNRVDEWLSQEYSTDGLTLDEIPYDETEKYVDKVMKAYDKYKELYEIG